MALDEMAGFGLIRVSVITKSQSKDKYENTNETKVTHFPPPFHNTYRMTYTLKFSYQHHIVCDMAHPFAHILRSYFSLRHEWFDAASAPIGSITIRANECECSDLNHFTATIFALHSSSAPISSQ